MKKFGLAVITFVVAVCVAFLLVGCEESASQNNDGLVDGFLVRVNEKPETTPGTGISMYDVTVSSKVSGALGSGKYVVGTTVIIDAGTLPNPYRFVEWTTTSKGVTFADPNKARTQFSMPANNVTVTAAFWDYGTFTDNRDSKTYKTTTIGSHTWMAENLNYSTLSDSWCLSNKPDNCDKYGRLYDWNTAMTVCPSGWHLPTREEWGDLAKAAGGTGDYGTGGLAGIALKSTSGWKSGGNGTDEFGFTALMGESRGPDGVFNISYGGHWWTATTDVSSGIPYLRNIYNDEDRVSESIPVSRNNGESVRCVRD